jgi:hypothetical protein
VGKYQASARADHDRVVTGPDATNQIYKGTLADIDALAGVYLYSNRSALRQVTTTPARPAGRCA